MFLPDYKIEQLCDEQSLVVPFKKDRVQPHSIDLTLGDHILFPQHNAENLHTYGEENNKWEPIYTDEKTGIIYLPPLCFALAYTKETISIPEDLVGMVEGKSTIARRGLQIHCAGLVDAGFRGQITLELFNQAPYHIPLREDMPICQMTFTQVEAPNVSYSECGHYMNQRGPTPPYQTL